MDQVQEQHLPPISTNYSTAPDAATDGAVVTSTNGSPPTTTSTTATTSAATSFYRTISGSCEEQGSRKTMEDTHIRIDDVPRYLQQKQQQHSIGSGSFYGVYDGHGGSQTAKMVGDKLHEIIFSSEHFATGNIQSAFHSSFETMDKLVVAEANKQNLMHGCTCVCCLILDGTVYFANIGDSEGILVSLENGAVVPKNMTRPHKANDPSEKARIESLGGHVFFGRVYGSLAVSRSFGDSRYKKPKTTNDFVSCEPHIEVQRLDSSHRYIILACDGLFDVMNHQEVAEMTHKLFTEGYNASNVAQRLVTRAIKELQTEDNVTVIVVKIDWSDSTEQQQQQPPQTTDLMATSSIPTTTSSEADPLCSSSSDPTSSTTTNSSNSSNNEHALPLDGSVAEQLQSFMKLEQ